MTTIDEYIAAVLRHLPPGFAEARGVGAELRDHLADRMLAGDTEGAAIARMGEPSEVAEAFLAGFRMRRAPLPRRLAAFLVDLSLGLVLILPLLGLFIGQGPETVPGPWELLIVLLIAGALGPFVLAVVYFPAAEAIWGRTLGKWLFGLCVVHESGTRIGWKGAILRRIPFYFEFFWLDALFALFTRDRQRAFDKVAGTRVVVCEPAGGTPGASGERGVAMGRL
jgi:uncharacterized RDD family membrane protein YckC